VPTFFVILDDLGLIKIEKNEEDTKSA